MGEANGKAAATRLPHLRVLLFPGATWRHGGGTSLGGVVAGPNSQGPRPPVRHVAPPVCEKAKQKGEWREELGPVGVASLNYQAETSGEGVSTRRNGWR